MKFMVFNPFFVCLIAPVTRYKGKRRNAVAESVNLIFSLFGRQNYVYIQKALRTSGKRKVICAPVKQVTSICKVDSLL